MLEANRQRWSQFQEAVADHQQTCELYVRPSGSHDGDNLPTLKTAHSTTGVPRPMERSEIVVTTFVARSPLSGGGEFEGVLPTCNASVETSLEFETPRAVETSSQRHIVLISSIYFPQGIRDFLC